VGAPCCVEIDLAIREMKYLWFDSLYPRGLNERRKKLKNFCGSRRR
jgi:hypothetical protein